MEEGILAVHVSHLRKTLGDTKGRPEYTQTVPRAGYRFIVSLTKAATAVEETRDACDAASTTAPSSIPRTPEVYEVFGRARAHLLTASFFELPKASPDSGRLSAWMGNMRPRMRAWHWPTARRQNCGRSRIGRRTQKRNSWRCERLRSTARAPTPRSRA